MYVQSGFLLAANFLDALLQEQVRTTLQQCGPTFTLLLTGHSLGAGIASILTMKWRQLFPCIRCVALSPPCVFTLAGARAARHWITSVVIGDDMVSRWSLSSSYDLRNACIHLHNATRHDVGMDPVHMPNCERNSSVESTGTIDSPLAMTEEGTPDHGSSRGNLTKYILDTHERCNRESIHYQYATLDNSYTDMEMFEYSQYTTLEPITHMRHRAECNTGAHCETQIEEADTMASGASPTSHGLDNNDRNVDSSASPPAPSSLRDLQHIMDCLRCEHMVLDKLYPPGRLVHIVDSDAWERDVAASAVDVVPPSASLWSDTRTDDRAWQTEVGGCGDTHVELSDGRRVEIICRSADSVAYAADQLTFAELQLSADMFSSHMPTKCLHKLRELFPLST